MFRACVWRGNCSTLGYEGAPCSEEERNRLFSLKQHVQPGVRGPPTTERSAVTILIVFYSPTNERPVNLTKYIKALIAGMMEGQGRTALVTGSTSGIGLGVAKVLAAKGCNITVTGLGSQELIDRCTAEIKSAGKDRVSVNYLAADLRVPEGIQKLCEEALKLHPKGVDILVNNAGIQHVSPVEDFPLDKWNDLISIHLTAPFLLIKHLLPQMKTNGWGRIVNIASAHGLVASVAKAGYVSAKHGLVGLTKVVALETAKTSVTCNAICPGWVLTELVQKQIDELAAEKHISTEKAQEILLQKMPSGKPVTTEEVGELVAYLCSPAANNIRGSSLSIDGGWVAQ